MLVLIGIVILANKTYTDRQERKKREKKEKEERERAKEQSREHERARQEWLREEARRQDGERRRREEYAREQERRREKEQEEERQKRERTDEERGRRQQYYSGEEYSKACNTFGLPKTAGFEEFKHKYRALMNRHHPDRHTKSNRNAQEEAHRRTVEINQAWECIKARFEKA